LKRTLGAGAFAREPGDADFKWLWAGYRLGSFPTTFFEPGLGQRPFAERLAMVLRSVGYSAILVAKTDKGMIPVGIVLGEVKTRNPPHRPVIEPHVVWFKWAPLRPRLQAAVRFLHDVRREYFVVIYAETKDKAFFIHLCRYGLLQRVGTLVGFFEGGRTDCALFQGRVGR
jgi:hypothetical protein